MKNTILVMDAGWLLTKDPLPVDLPFKAHGVLDDLPEYLLQAGMARRRRAQPIPFKS